MAYIGNQPFTTAFLTDQFSGNGFVPMLIKAVQEQQALIESLTARIAALEAK